MSRVLVKNEVWICGNKVIRALTGDEILDAFDEAQTAWRIVRTVHGKRGAKVEWAAPVAVYVLEAREAQRVNRVPVFWLANGTFSFRCSTRYGDEWYFLSSEILTSLPELVHP